MTSEFEENILPQKDNSGSVFNVSEFDESRSEQAKERRTLRFSAWHKRITKKKSMRLLVGLPVVYTALILYGGLFATVVFGWAPIETVKDLAALLAVPGTLAATIVGFFFGGKSTKRTDKNKF